MELVKKAVKRDHEIVYSRAVKAGKRIYYLDVKKNRKNDLFLCITESKKVVWGDTPETQQVQFEKHKIFLYKEDFDKFADGLSEVIEFIKKENRTPYKLLRNNEKEDGATVDEQNTMANTSYMEEEVAQEESFFANESEIEDEPFFRLNLEEFDA